MGQGAAVVMRLPSPVTRWLIGCARRVIVSRPPDRIIGPPGDPYLLRWYAVPQNRWLSVYVHVFLRSDDARALHDHPWANVSVLLEGSYVEHTIRPGGINVRTPRSAGAVKFRTARAAHRIELTDGLCLTLFLTGPRVREWGFHCAWGWRHWRDFTSGPNGETIGKGCDQ